jgi:hypothetical protein
LEYVEAGRVTGYQPAIAGRGPQMSDVNKAAIQYLKACGASAISVVRWPMSGTDNYGARIAA